MIRLQVLGSIDLRAPTGDAISAVLSQPKRLGLLAYLALGPAQALKRRDTLLALFWPEQDEPHARNALSKALHHLRRSLGADAIIARGDNEVGVSSEAVWCDAHAFETALDAGQERDGLALYRGNLLSGFHVAGASAEFSQWIDDERNRLRARAAGAAWKLAEAAARDSKADDARQWSQWAALASPDDERALRRLISLLLSIGDRAGALRAYDNFARRLATEFEARPAEETRQLIAEASGQEQRDAPPKSAVTSNGNRTPAGAEMTGHQSPRPTPGPMDSVPPAAVPSLDSVALPDTPAPGRRWLWAMVGAVAAVSALAAYGATAGRHSQAAASTPPPSSTIAVMPIENLGPGHGDDYFADGMTEELIARLARVNGLRVVGRSSALSFKGKAVRAQDVGRALGASTLLEGSVERVGQRLRLTAELIDARQGYTLWTQSYDRDLKDVFAVQDELTTAIVSELGHRFGALHLPAARTDSVRDTLAYEMYLRARYFVVRHNEPAMKLALRYYGRAIARDPNYADAYAGIADVYASLAGQGYMDNQRGKTLARKNALRALALDSTSSAAHSALGFIQLYQEWHGDSADAELRKALALDPNDQGARMLHAWYYIAVDRTTDAATEARRSMAVDPVSLLFLARGAEVLTYAARYDEAAAVARRAMEMGSTYGLGYWALAAVLVQEHRAREAIPLYQRAQQLTGIMGGALGYAYAVSGDTADAHRYLDAMTRYSRTHYLDPYERALVYAGLQQADSAMQWLQRAYASRSKGLTYLRTEPMLNGVRQDPRFAALVRKVGL